MIYQQPDPSIEGWIDDDELQWLFNKAQSVASIVEIGSWRGLSSHALLSGCPGPVFCIDTFKGTPNELDGAHVAARTEDIYQSFYSNVGHFSNLVVLQMSSLKAVQFFRDKSIDMIFIDGDHKYPAPYEDIRSWMPICKRILCGHDVHQDGVPRSLEEMRLSFKNKVGSIWEVEL